MFGTLSDKFTSVFRKISGQSQLTESNVREAMGEVRSALLEADVHHQVVDSFMQHVLDQSLGAEVLKSVRPGQQMIKVVYDELVRTMAAPAPGSDDEDAGDAPATAPGHIMFVSPGPTVIMMCGLQGSGKTTTCGKLAAYLKKKGKNVMLAAADLQRPAAVTQLQVLSQQVETDAPGGGMMHFYAEADKVAEYGKAVGAAVTVCRNALQAARAKKCDVLILDTAGRLHVNDALMDELRQVNAAVKPHQIFLVLDAMTGQDAVNSAKAFNDQLELDGVILTKFDSDTRGGAALSVRQITGKPIKFIGVGEKLEALEEFHPERIASRILGMGDVVSLVEKAQEQVSEEEAAALQEKMAQGKLTMEDFLKQLKHIRRMGPLKSLMGMLPGIGTALQGLDLDEKQIDRTEAIIHSMTAKERQDVEVLDNSRRRRISRGSGTEQQDVSQLVRGFHMVSQMSQQMSNMNMVGRLRSMAGINPSDLMNVSRGRGAPNLPGAPSGKPQRPKFKERKRKRR